jgi:hypothetical protein
MKNLTSIAEHSKWLGTKFEDVETKWKLHCKRIIFGEQPLELWMFVPCDEDGNVLEEPTEKDEFRYCNGTEYYPHQKKQYAKEYQQAKERCLFEGFELKGQTNYSFVYKNKNIFPYFISKKGTIEELTFHISNCDLQLTQTAIKQLSL